jgi:hypothetical protein
VNEPYDAIKALIVGFDQWKAPSRKRVFSLLKEELRLAKAGALYADEVFMASQASAIAVPVLIDGAKKLPDDLEDREIPVAELVAGLGEAEESAAVDLIAALGYDTVKALNPFEAGFIFGCWMDGEVPPGWLPLTAARTVEATQPEVFARSYVEFAQSPEGKVQIDELKTMADSIEDEKARKLVLNSLDRMQKVRAGDLSALMPPPSPRPQSAEAKLLVNVLGGLRAFPDADWDVILDVRERLGTSRVRFRAAIAKAAEDLKDCEDDELQGAANSLKRQVIAPALAEIDTALDELDAVPTLLRMGQGPSMAAAIGANLALIAGDPAALGIGAVAHGLASSPMIASGLREMAHRRNERKRLSAQPFWVLHELRDAKS